MSSHHSKMLSLYALLLIWTVGAISPHHNTPGAATTEIQEIPLALPLAEKTLPTKSVQGEIWEEDDHEILIRNERGTKNDGKSNNLRFTFWTSSRSS